MSPIVDWRYIDTTMAVKMEPATCSPPPRDMILGTGKPLPKLVSPRL